MRSPQRTFVACLLTLATIGLVLPAEALAQRHHHHGRSRVVVGVGVPYYSPFYSYYGWWGPWGPWGYWAPPYGYYGAYDYASEVMSFNATFADAQEGMCAFLQKRKPTWSGR